MEQYDLSTANGQQAFQRWLTQIIRNEINTYVNQVLFDRNAVNITTPSVGDSNPAGGTYTADQIQNLRLDRLEQTTFRR